MKKTNLLKTVLIPSLSLVTFGTIAATSTSCAQSSDEPDSNYMVVRPTTNAIVTFNHHNHDTETIYSARPSIEFSYNKEDWYPLTMEEEGSAPISLITRSLSLNANQKLYLRGDNKNGFSQSTKQYSSFSFVGRVSISGNVMGLVDNGTGSMTEIPNNFCFYDLFRDAATIDNVSKKFLSAATSLTFSCYDGMFYRCQSLKQAPDLPATKLNHDCYSHMFDGCASLKEAPYLPAALDEGHSYDSNNWKCYNGIFLNCTSMQSIKIGYTGEFTEDIFERWVENVSNKGVFYYNGGGTVLSFGFSDLWTLRKF